MADKKNKGVTTKIISTSTKIENSNTPANKTLLNEPESLIEFPCEFPIKVMGETHVDFASEIIKTIQLQHPDFNASNIEMRGSSGGKYMSLTCTVYVSSRLQLDNIYRALSAHPMVKVTL